MAEVTPLSPGVELASYRFHERIGSFVWRCEDTRNGKAVAVKILTRQLPSDPARREDIFKHVRVGAALYHPFLVPIVDVVPAGDMLLLVMELISGQPLMKAVAGKPRDAAEALSIGYQLSEVLRFLHARDVIHGNVSGDSVFVGNDGHVRLAGLNLLNLMARKGGSPSAIFQQKGNDPRAVAYMSPEQITGAAIDARTDVYSFGIVMYEVATGVLPCPRGTAAEIARSIVDGKPYSPRAMNPQIETRVVETLAHCMAKDPAQRHKDGKALAEEIGRVAPAAVQFANDLAGRAHAAINGEAKKNEAAAAILLLADVDSDDLELVTRVGAKMQQIVGEAAYLFDGKVIDPFGTRLVAEMPSVQAGIEAGRKAEFDLLAEEENGEELPIRLLLHAGEITVRDGSATGDALTRGFGAMVGAQHRQLLLTEEFVKLGRAGLRLRDAGARGGVKLFEIAAAQRQAPSEASLSTPTPTTVPMPTMTSVATVEFSGPPLDAAAPRRKRSFLAAGAALLLLAIGAGGVMLSRRSFHAAAPVAVLPPAAAVVREVVIAPFAVDAADPVMSERATAMRLAIVEILRRTQDLHVVDQPSRGAVVYGASIRSGTGGPLLVPTKNGTEAGQPVPFADNASAVQTLVAFIAKETHARPHVTEAAAALNGFVDALSARANNDAAKTNASLHAAIAADPGFLPLQVLAMDFFTAEGSDTDAYESAKQVFALAPENSDAARLVARGDLARGEVGAALVAYGQLLRKERGDLEALNTIGHYAFSAGDVAHFNATLARLKAVKAAAPAIHEPDLLTASGRFDDAVQQYYDIEVDDPNNAALALKIGRIAVLRHTMDIARLELKKLQQSDPDYGYHLLAAYLAAGERSRGDAERELQTALKASKPGDSYWTSAAEVYAIMGDARKVLSSLQTAADRREPTISYVLADPLFTFVGSEPKFSQLRTSLLTQKNEIRAALAKIAI